MDDVPRRIPSRPALPAPSLAAVRQAVGEARAGRPAYFDATTLGTSAGLSAYWPGNTFFRSATLGRSL